MLVVFATALSRLRPPGLANLDDDQWTSTSNNGYAASRAYRVLHQDTARLPLPVCTGAKKRG